MLRRMSYKLIAIIAALCILVAFACISVSKFVLSDRKELVGVYTDFVLSHDGDGQTAVVKTDAQGVATGYIATTISNFTEEKVSKRDVEFSLRAPTAAEVGNGYVVDAWGGKHQLQQASRYYDVAIVDDSTTAVISPDNLPCLRAADGKTSTTLLLRITRRADAPAMPNEGTEQISIILQTSRPYKDLQIFHINATMARLSVGVSSDDYNGYTRKTVNLKSTTDFVRNSTATGEDYLARVKFTLTGEVAFDAAKYVEMYGDEYAPILSENRDIIYFTIRAGADVNLYFYVKNNFVGSVTVEAEINDGYSTAPWSEKVSGVGNDKVVFAR